MRDIVRTLKIQQGLMIGGTVLWGVMEFVALQRMQLKARPRRSAQRRQMRRAAMAGHAH